VKRAALLAMWLFLCAHVGSPDTYFEGTAGPYPVRVVIRNPSVVPGLAQISVRLLAPYVVRRVLVLPVFWDPRTAAPPPPDLAQRVAGDSMLYSSALWLMSRGSYGVEVTVEGEAGTGRALVPVMAVATSRLALQKRNLCPKSARRSPPRRPAPGPSPRPTGSLSRGRLRSWPWRH